MKRTICSLIYIDDINSLTPEQREYLDYFASREQQVAEAECHREAVTESEFEEFTRPYARLKMTIEVKEVGQHNPNGGVVVYGAKSDDVDKIYRILGEDVFMARGARKVEAFR